MTRKKLSIPTSVEIHLIPYIFGPLCDFCLNSEGIKEPRGSGYFAIVTTNSQRNVHFRFADLVTDDPYARRGPERVTRSPRCEAKQSEGINYK